MTAAPISAPRSTPVTIAPVDILVSVPRRHELRSFCEAVRTAIRFVPLPPAERTIVIADLQDLEDETERETLRPHVVAALRWKIESLIETYAGGPDLTAQAG